MKKATVYILVLVMLLGCLAGCMRNDPMEQMPTPTPYSNTPSATARPVQTPYTNDNDNNDGMVNEGNGIIEDNDGNGTTPPDKDDRPLDNDILQNDLNNNGNSGTVTTPGTTTAPSAKSRVRR